MHVITFLGTGQYQPVSYIWRDSQLEYRATTDLFPLALVEWLQPESIFVLLTPEAEQSEHWRRLHEALGELAQPVEIPSGKDESELWHIFDRLAAVVPVGARLVLDVTHGLRTLPLFVVTAALLLRQLRDPTVERILYGAYEARDPATGETPVFDLTPLIDLADWLSGIEALQRSGDGRSLASRLAAIHDLAYRRRAPELPRRLKRVGRELETFSESVRLNRPVEALGAAHRLREELSRAEPELARWAPPFALLADRIAAEVASLAYPDAETLDASSLQAQLALVEYALAKGLVLQAVTLMREWLVSWYLWLRFPERAGEWRKKHAREPVEQELNHLARSLREGAPVPGQLPDGRAAALWGQVTQLRNDLAHCGMREDAVSPETARQRAEGLVAALRELLEAAPRR